jgi:hypothetical protein
MGLKHPPVFGWLWLQLWSLPIPRVNGLLSTAWWISPSAAPITPSLDRPSIGDLLFGGLRAWPVHIHVRVIPTADVPKTGEEISTWAMDTFKFKIQGRAAAWFQLSRRMATFRGRYLWLRSCKFRCSPAGPTPGWASGRPACLNEARDTQMQ